MDVEQWRAFGGSVDGKVYVAPNGEWLQCIPEILQVDRTGLGTPC